MTTATTVSAPGKVLLAGGYLVLESPNVGLVIGANQRFYCTVESTLVPFGDDAQQRVAPSTTLLAVHSPQFHSSWTYQHQNDESSIQLWQLETASSEQPQDASTTPPRNPFVESTLRLVLAYYWSKEDLQQTHRDDENHRAPLKITIRADNDFYSLLPHLPPPPLDVPTYLTLLSELPRFVPCPVDETTGKPRIHKTGLGSSAALVTSLVAALYYHFSSSSDSTKTATNDHLHLAKIHRLAQLCHCHAQGKVGSGFDVSAAIHGSHVYQKQFPPIFYQLMTLLEEQQTNHHDEPIILPKSLARQIQQYIDDDDTNTHQTNGGSVIVAPISLHAVGLQLILADVSGGGSESPSMARQILAWKQQQQQAEQQLATTEPVEKNEWDQLKNLNQHIVDLLQQLTEISTSSSTYPEELDALSKVAAIEWNNVSMSPSSCQTLLYELHKAFQATRHSLKSMGDKAGVPVEPNVQTDLCDATMALPGVVTALVPGAGGYDAIACLYMDRPGVREGIMQLWLDYNETATKDGTSGIRILPLSVQAVGFGDGLRIETDG